jgi:isopentenyldiphosphate isomerase
MADELLDIVNDNDIVTGHEMRSTVHQLGLQHRGAHVFLFTRDGKMLLQKRSAVCWMVRFRNMSKLGKVFLVQLCAVWRKRWA